VVLLQPPLRRWECPNCDRAVVTRDAAVEAPYHNCRGLHGLSAPLIPAGTRARVEAREREDYVGDERPHTVEVDGKPRPVMSIVVTRDDGQDCTVLAPQARANGATGNGLV
jgi:hypothetical protein